MATLKNRRKSWYARVIWYDKTGKQKEKQVPLRTKFRVEAVHRLMVVNRDENDIKDGISFMYPWMRDDGQKRILRFTLKDAVDLWMKSKKSSGVRQTTIIRYKCSLNSLFSLVSENIPLKEVNTNLIDRYKNLSLENGLTANGVNINLRSIKVFLRWCKVREYIDKVPHIGMIKTPKASPLYISDRNFAEIMRLPWLNQNIKNMFWFYRKTGCRLSEPFIGKLNGCLLLISGEYTKEGVDKEIFLSNECVGIYNMMINRRMESKGTLKSWTESLSKVFLKAVREIDGSDTKYHFHCLRHTFAVRRYLQTRDIYLVKKEMGHLSVTTTEKYAKFSLQRLQIDFPNIIEKNKKKVIGNNGHEITGHNSDFKTICLGT